MRADVRLLDRLRSLSPAPGPAPSAGLGLSGLDFLPPRVRTIEVPLCFLDGEGPFEAAFEAASGGHMDHVQRRTVLVGRTEWRLTFGQGTL